MASSGIFIFSFLFCMASFAWASSRYVTAAASSGNFFNVMDFGAIGDGRTDDSLAFLKAFSMACNSSAPSTISIPGKTFLLNTVKFNGPCKSATITVQISGILTAPSDMSEWKTPEADFWIAFDSINGLRITGSGTGQIDGHGLSWWKCKNDQKCSRAPNTLKITNTIGLRVDGLKFIDSPHMHLVIGESRGVQVSQLSIVAPEDSPNTDGIHITNCQLVEITDSVIRTGDDCISIETGSANVTIRRIKCGPGHGISIGSLGDDGTKAIVEQIHVSDCEFFGTMTGARIKTWQGGSGFARGISFENSIMTSVDHPIVIDQYYCNDEHSCNNQTSAVQISNIWFTSIKGSTTRDIAIDLACSKTVPCTGIHLRDIDLRRDVIGKETAAYCDNVSGTATSVRPFVKCLAQ